MEQTAFIVPGTLKHAAETEADLIKEMRTYVGAQPGVRFLADVLLALHAPGSALRDAAAFYTSFGPSQILQAMSQRPDLRVRLLRAITGAPAGLLRRQSPADLASQIELLVMEDLPAAERGLRAEEDRAASVVDLYFKYVDATDAATYLPAAALWQYEGKDRWWTREATATTRAMMAAELKSIRRHGIVSDSELLDLIGNEAFERDLPLAVRTSLRTAARKAAREGRPFRDNDLFGCLPAGDSKRDLTDELCDSVSLLALRKVVDRAAEVLGWAAKVETKIDIKIDIKSDAATPVKEAPPAVVEGGPTRGPVKPLSNLFTSAAGARTPEPVSKTPPPVTTAPRPFGAAKPAAGKPALAKAEAPPASARRSSQRALTPVSTDLGDDILLAVDVPFAEDHLPSFTDIADSDAVEEQSR